MVRLFWPACWQCTTMHTKKRLYVLRNNSKSPFSHRDNAMLMAVALSPWLPSSLHSLLHCCTINVNSDFLCRARAPVSEQDLRAPRWRPQYVQKSCNSQICSSNSRLGAIHVTRHENMGNENAMYGRNSRWTQLHQATIHKSISVGAKINPSRWQQSESGYPCSHSRTCDGEHMIP